MGALSIAIVQAEARAKVSPHLTLARLNSKNCFEWVFSKGTTRNAQEVPVDKIRGIKMDEWLRYARGLVEGKPVDGAPPIVLNAPAERSTGPAGGPNPSFMLVRNRQPVAPFNNEDPQAQGYNDAKRGITACPFGLKRQVELWNQGHDRAFAEGLAEKRRFGLTVGRRN